MCGIAGVLNYSSPPSSEVLGEMLKPVHYRGPDSSGYYRDKHIGLGIKRLKIIDLATGDQPVFNEDKTACGVFNGEIYNYKILRKDLIKKGHVFRSHSDSEVLVHLYEEYGEDIPLYLDGMFAFAIWDKKEKKLFIARDRFGIKPLYYAAVSNTFLFGSEPKTILASKVVKNIVSSQAISLFFLLGYIPGVQSAYEQILKLPPGHSMLVSEKGYVIRQYWDISDQPREQSDSLETLIEHSVKKQLVADVPLGIFLSGGIDSSLVTYFAVKNSNRKIKTFSVSFHESSYDESPYALQVAKHIGTEHCNSIFTSKDFLSTYSQVISNLDEPFADASIFPSFFLAKQAKKQVTVCLSGDGGDELFAGYPTYQAFMIERLIKHVPKIVFSLLGNLLPDSYSNISLKEQMRNYTENVSYDYLIRHLYWTVFSQTKMFNTYTNEAYKGLKPIIRKTETKAFSDVKKLMYLDINTYLPDDLLFKVDRAGMYNSLEVRVPFLTGEIAQCAFGLAETDLVTLFQTKKKLRKIVNKYLPRDIAKRKKKGFGVPLKLWFKTQLKTFVYDELSSNRISDFVGGKYTSLILSEHYEKEIDHTRTILKLLMLRSWLKKYI